jgi:peptidoglycan/xylan/chitin deacetylase (PgdA/CDA1 family)
MILLHNVGTHQHSNYNTRDQIKNCKEQLSFDGVYLNVWENRDLLLNRSMPTILFVMGDHVGGDNTFDRVNGVPYERYCTWDQIMDLKINFDCELGWHTWSHRNLTNLSYDEIVRECMPPFPMDYFSYPYGDLNENVERSVKSVGYKKAYSVHQGNGTQFQKKRYYLNH